jgi:hypothetical protein
MVEDKQGREWIRGSRGEACFAGRWLGGSLCEVVVDAVLLPRPWLARGVADREAQAPAELRHELADQRALPHPRRAADDHRPRGRPLQQAGRQESETAKGPADRPSASGTESCFFTG